VILIGALDRAVTSELGDSQWPPRAELGTEVGVGGHGVGREGGRGRARLRGRRGWAATMDGHGNWDEPLVFVNRDPTERGERKRDLLVGHLAF